MILINTGEIAILAQMLDAVRGRVVVPGPEASDYERAAYGHYLALAAKVARFEQMLALQPANSPKPKEPA